MEINIDNTSKIVVNELKIGQYFIYEYSGESKQQICKIIDISTAKPGKHGSAKFLIKAKDIETNANVELCFTSGTKITVLDKLKE
jgi:translation elongation factor P/translation initiation factor 5A